MGTGASAGGAHVADDLSLAHGIALRDDIVGHVGVEAGVAVAVVDGDVVAVGAAVGGHGDLAAAGGPDGRALGVGQVDAVVELPLTGDGMGAVAVGRGQPDPGAGSAPALVAARAAAAGAAVGAAAGITTAGAAAGITAAVAGLLDRKSVV